MNRFALMFLAFVMSMAQANSQDVSGKPAAVTFYRYNTKSDTSASIKVDGPKVTHKLPSYQFWTTELAAGEHTIAGDEIELAKSYAFEAGKTYYFRIELIQPGGVLTLKRPRFRIYKVTADMAEAEMIGLKKSN